MTGSKNIDEIHSVRIFTVDFYLIRPIPELDVTVSDFRGCEIKQVPILRIFGANRNGKKVCLHVHGVFPYFYIPCEDSNPEPRLAYQLANSIDKAINISLKQTNSETQHVYKISVVKGIPFYGYHRKEHQFYKIYLYNPSFVKKTADLLQNGAIMEKVFQPHEAHINFVMQFFIDFNLYGMSFIHLEHIKYRKRNTSLQNVPSDDVLEQTSVCELEMDVLAQCILNKREIADGNLGVNPGLEALWLDEKQRCPNMESSVELLPTPSQLRENYVGTDSHNYHRTKLIAKLIVYSEAFNESSDSTFSSNFQDSEQSTVNNTVYPAETPDETNFLDATKVILHHPNSSSGEMSFSSPHDYTVNEDIVSQCTQSSASQLNEDDMELVAALHDLERVDDDSILGTPAADDLEDEEKLDIGDKADAKEEDNDKTLTESTSQASEWNDSFWENVENISQIDGAWDDEDASPSRKVRKKLRLGLSKPHRTTKKQKPFSPKSDAKLSKLKEEFKSIDDQIIQKVKKGLRKSPKRSPKKSPKKSPQKTPRNFDPLAVTIKPSSPIKTIFSPRSSQTVADHKENNSNVDPVFIEDKIDLVETTDIQDVIMESPDNAKLSNLKSLPRTKKIERNSKRLTSSQYDRQNNFVPQAGSSNCQNLDMSQQTQGSLSDDDSVENSRHVISFYDTTNYHNCSIFNSETVNTSVVLDKKSSAITDDLNLWLSNSPSTRKSLFISQNKDDDKSRKILVPKLGPPTAHHVKSTMDDLNARVQQNTPFYSKFEDAGGQIEIGSIVLKLRTSNNHFVKEFPSSIPNGIDLNSWRKKIFTENNMTQVDVEAKDLDILLSNNRSCVLTPLNRPPSLTVVKKWLNSSKNVKSCKKAELEDAVAEKQHFLVPGSPGQEISESQVEILSLSTASQSSIATKKSQENCSQYSNCSQETASSDTLVCGQTVCDSEDFDTTLIPVEFEENKEETDNNVTDSMTDCLLNSTRGFKHSADNYQDQTSHEYEYLTLLTCEIHALTRGDLYPDPQIDPICAVYYSILNDCPEDCHIPRKINGMIVVEPNSATQLSRLYPEIDCNKYTIARVDSEETLFDELVKLILKWDPDIFCGYEIEMSSWGYLVQRANIFGVNLASKISRVPIVQKKYNNEADSDGEIKIIGRIMLNMWKLLRHEIALTGYSFENVFYHVLHERIPKFSHATLTFWWNQPSMMFRSKCLQYFFLRTTGAVRILLQLDLIGRTSELAKLFGIQWYEVLSRGSQFRVESMMIRLSRPYNYVLVSPSIQQRAAMKAPECLPLILEPESRFYGDPIIVLDFQSLYPSMMIAYNLCYSTCVGKVENLGKNIPFQFGASLLRISPKLLKKLNERDMINWSPCGVGFVKPTIRKGILPKMLEDILNTRFMVKKSMKKNKANKTLSKILHNRQLGLKLIANVTYGYTAANFSGRMPCVEVGDSVVSKGRETLERAIHLIEQTPKWKARVVYGDTDSVFVLVAGRSRDEAFDIGAEIAEAVTNDNPTPVKLKLEKVYQPCILQTKKRYVGYMYESKNQASPDYEAKGIETVRRDGCPATAKILERSLRILFETYDMSKVKAFVCHKFEQIVEDKCSVRDFVFAREFRGMHAYKPTASIPALEIARKLKAIDHRREPREGERVPYVIVNTAPGQTLLQSARCPRDLLADRTLRLNHNYYITKVIIPPLNRCFSLVGVDVTHWFAQISRKQHQFYPILDESDNRNAEHSKKSTISQYFSKVNCAGCENPTIDGLCLECRATPHRTLQVLHRKMNDWQRSVVNMTKICQSCCGRATQTDCSSIDCPVLFALNDARRHAAQIPFVRQMEEKLLDF